MSSQEGRSIELSRRTERKEPKNLFEGLELGEPLLRIFLLLVKVLDISLFSNLLARLNYAKFCTQEGINVILKQYHLVITVALRSDCKGLLLRGAGQL